MIILYSKRNGKGPVVPAVRTKHSKRLRRGFESRLDLHFNKGEGYESICFLVGE
jgi:hypothetical protein